MAEQKVAVITGVSSGLGRATAEELIERGYRVFGTVRSASAEVPRGVETVILDVCDNASVAIGIAEILGRAKRIDALVNNAGGSMVGAIEETDTEQAKALFDKNFFGAVRMTQSVLPIMRAQRGGRIVYVSSVLGFLPAPFMAFYSASKHALEGYSESLDHEMRTLGIRSILVQPGFMKTRISQNSAQAANTISDYSLARSRVAATVRANVEAGEDPVLAAKTIWTALSVEKPRLRYPVGKQAGMLSRLRRLVPSPMFDKTFRKKFNVDG